MAVSALALAACAPQQQAGPAPSPTPAPAPTVTSGPANVALLAPISAENEGAAVLGGALANAARMAATELGPELVRLTVLDTAGTTTSAVEAASRAAEAGADIVIGPLFSANVRAIAPGMASNGINAIAFSTDTTVAGDPIYLSGYLPEAEARRLVSYARSQGIERFALFYPLTPYGNAAARAIRTAAGASLVTDVSYQRSETGIRSGIAGFMADARASGATGVFFVDSGAGLELIGTEIEENEIDTTGMQPMGLGQWNSAETFKTFAVFGGWFPAPDPAALKPFVTRYQDAHDAAPPPLAILGYDAVQIVGQLALAARAGTADPYGDAQITRAVGFRGAAGPIRFLTNGQGERGLAILEVGQGIFVTRDPAPTTYNAGF